MSMVGQGTISGSEIARRARMHAPTPAQIAAARAEEEKRKATEAAERSERLRREEIARQASLRPVAFRVPDDVALARAEAKLASLKSEIPALETSIRATSEKIEALRRESIGLDALSRLKAIAPGELSRAKGVVVTESSKLADLRDSLEATRQAHKMQSDICETRRGEVQRAAVAQCQAAQRKLLPELVAALREVYRVVGTVEDIEDEAARVTGRSCMLPISPFPLRGASRGMRCDCSNEPLFFYLDMLKRSGFDVATLISK